MYPWSSQEAEDPAFVAKKMMLWQDSFWDWFLDNVHTSDEVDSLNPVKPAPAFRYLQEIDKIERESKVSVIVKSRRMFISHYEYAKTLWSFLFVPFSKNLVIAKKEVDVRDAMRSRILAMYYRLDPRFPCHVKLKPRTHIHELELIHPDRNMGSHIMGLPSGADQVRQYTATRILVDEFAFHDKTAQEQTFDAIAPAISGPNGKATIVSTPCPDTKFEKLTQDLNPDIPIREIMPGLSVGVNRLNQTVIFLKYMADPNKRTQAWYYKEKYGTTVEGIPIPGASGVDEFTWRREYELSFEFPVGEPVVPEFKKELHCAAYATHGQILPDKALEVGLDFGSRFPAVVFSQVDSLGRLIIHDGIMPQDMNLDRFLIKIDNEIKTKYKDIKRVNFYCDPAGGSRSNQGTAPPAVQSVFEYFKVKPKYVLSKPEDRARAIRKLAGQLIGGVPGLIVNPLAGLYITPGGKEQAGIIPKALEIGWVYDENKASKLEPLKEGFYEHIMDALGYQFIFLYPSLFEDAKGVRKRMIHMPSFTRKFLRR